MASRMSVEPTKLYDTLRETVFKKATNEELLALVVVANEYDLNPFLKEIYAFPAKGGGVVPIISVDGWNKMLVRQEQFDGIEFSFEEGEDGKPISCTCTIYCKNRSRPVTVKEYYNECYRNTEPWNNMPHRMLRNRTLCQGSRIAFGFSAQLHEDEVIDVVSTVIPTERQLPSSPPPKVVPLDQPPSSGPSNPETKYNETGAKSPQDQLEAYVITEGFTFSDFQKFGVESGNIPDADSMTGFAEVPTKIAVRMLNAKAGLITALKKLKTGL
jgi:phage recombination protein Bet